MGLRGILWHQIGDLAHDRRAGVRTLATRIGAERGGQLLGWMVLLELLAAAASLLTIGVGIDQLWLPLFGAAYLTYRTFQMSILWTEPLRASALKHHNGRIRFIGFVVLNEFVPNGGSRRCARRAGSRGAPRPCGWPWWRTCSCSTTRCSSSCAVTSRHCPTR